MTLCVSMVLFPLNVWPLDYNFLTSQSLRLRTSDGGISWDQPSPLFQPGGKTGDPVAVDVNNVPIELMEVIGHLVACPDNGAYQAVEVPEDFCDGKPDGSLLVYNNTWSDAILPDGTVMAVSAVVGGVLQELDGTSTTATVDVADLEIPVNEEHFIPDRTWAEILGKALFWDVQVGNDGVQSCGSCRFHTGADNRIKNQLNPNLLGGDLTFQVRQPNEEVVGSDFPFHKRIDPDVVGDGTDPSIAARDANDVLSSMGVRFRLFTDIPTPGGGAFIPGVNTRVLRPDIGAAVPDPIPGFNGSDGLAAIRRVEPRNTPIVPLMPPHIAPRLSDLPAGELHPQIDELGFIVNAVTFSNGGPALEFSDNLSATDLHCGVYDPALFGFGPPSFGWGALHPVTGTPVVGVCSNNQSGVPGNMGLENTAGTNDAPLHGTYDPPNRVGRRGAFKAPPLWNVELTGPYFHTGSYLTLRQVVDFHMRAGGFLVTNAEGRDQHIVDIEEQAFGFGTTRIASNGGPIPDVPFADALPDPDSQYDPMPDTDHPLTPEYASQEDAKVSLVKLLLSLTDPRVNYERAPFDRPQLFVSIDGTSPDNFNGPTALAADVRLINLPAVGAGGNAIPLPDFLGIASVPVPGPNNDHFDR